MFVTLFVVKLFWLRDAFFNYICNTRKSHGLTMLIIPIINAQFFFLLLVAKDIYFIPKLEFEHFLKSSIGATYNKVCYG